MKERYQCPLCDTPHTSPVGCPQCQTAGPQDKLCRAHGTGYNPNCRACRRLAGV